MRDLRILRDGERLNYTCENRRFRTDIEHGERHGDAPARGSVFRQSLVADAAGSSLWLEHVEDKTTGERYYWLMWYDTSGMPTIPLSSVLTREDVATMSAGLARFIP